jgi:hypothetical protein
MQLNVFKARIIMRRIVTSGYSACKWLLDVGEPMGRVRSGDAWSVTFLAVTKCHGGFTPLDPNLL